LLIGGGVALLYFLAGHFALFLTNERDGVAVFWPASGVAAGAMVALGGKFRWPIALAVVIATVLANLQARSELALIAVFALSNAFECLLFAWIVRMLDRSRSRLESLGSVVVFLVAAAVGAALAAVPPALAIEGLTNSPARWTEIWFTWFKSDGLGIVVVAPVIITLPSFLVMTRRPLRLLECVVALLVAATTAYYAFGRTFSGLAPVPSPAMYLFPIFVWLAARTPIFIATLAAFLMSVVVVVLALAGDGTVADTAMPLAIRLGTAQSSLITGCGALLTLSAMFTRVNNVAMALQSSEQRLKLALTAASMYAFDFDLERDIVRRSGGLMPRLGLPEVGTAADYINALHPDDPAIFTGMLASISPAEPQLKRLVRMHDVDGKELAIEYRSEGEFNGDDRLVRLRGICVDVTDRERSRELVEKQAAQLSSALQAGRVFAYDFDNTTKTITRSANSVDILGIPREMLDEPRPIFIDMIHPEDRKAFIAYSRRAARDDRFRQQTFRMIRPDGRISWLEVTSTAEFDDTGKLTAIRGLARDVTEQTLWEQRQSMLIKELDHRVKNALARMAVVVKVSRDRHQTLDDYVKVIEGRIASMARTQERLSRNKWDGVDIEALVADELAAYRTPANCRIEGPGRLLDPIAAQGFAFTLHELATNAAKHGALSRPEGRVEVVWRIEEVEARPTSLHLTWREIVNGGIVPPRKESYGLDTIRNVLQYEQEATVNLDFTPNGLLCYIVVPLRWPAADAASSGSAGFTHLAPAAVAQARQ
jgi:PAS domain S-box-containing protein